MEIQHQGDEVRGTFYIEQENHRPARMTYIMSGKELMIIDHTEVASVFKGQGVGRDLVAAGVQFARDHRLKVIPLCPFARAEFEKHPEYQDIVAR